MVNALPEESGANARHSPSAVLLGSAAPSHDPTAPDLEDDTDGSGESEDSADLAVEEPDTVAAETRPDRAGRARFHSDDFFGHQTAPTEQLPPPEPLLENLTRCVIEILAGARDLEQISRWVTDDVYRHLLKRVVLSSRARQARGQAASRPSFSIGSTTISTPRDGVIEGVVIVRGRARSRAVAIRLEGLDHRWRATAINVL